MSSETTKDIVIRYEHEHERAQMIVLVASLLDTYRPLGVITWLRSRNARLESQQPEAFISRGDWQPLHEEAERLAGGPPGEVGGKTDEDRAAAIVALSKAIVSDRLAVGHAVALVADLLAEQRATIHAGYEKVAQRCDREAQGRSHFAKVDPEYRNTVIPYEAAADWIRAVAA